MKHECRCRTPGFCEHHGRMKVGRQWEICNHLVLTPERCQAYWCLWERNAGRDCDLESAVRSADRADRRPHSLRPLEDGTSCIHRGLLLRNEPREDADGKASMEHVFGCAMHGECSLVPYALGQREVVCCSCPDRVRKVVLSADTHGYGDACAAAWISEGAKAGPVRLVHYSVGPKADLLRLLGQDVTDDSTGVVNIESLGLLHAEYDQACAGGRLQFRSRALGIATAPQRPRAEIDPTAISWAAELTAGRRPILLCPQTCFVNREWPAENWRTVASLLRERDLYFLMLCGSDDPRYEDLPEFRKDTAGDLDRFAALVQCAAIVVGNDSFPVNLAGTLDVPALALCGPTTSAAFEGMPSVETIETPREIVPCSGCWFRNAYDGLVCDKGCVALANIPPDYVLERILHVVSNVAAQHADSHG